MTKLTYFTIGALVIAVAIIGIIGYSVRKPVVNVNIPEQQELGAVPGFGDTICFGGVCEKYITRECVNSTSTPISLKNPISATSTVHLSYFWERGSATSTHEWWMGTSTISSIASTTDEKGIASIISGGKVATTTKGSIVSGVRTAGGGSVDPGSASQYEIVLGPTEWIVGFASSTDGQEADWKNVKDWTPDCEATFKFTYTQ